MNQYGFYNYYDNVPYMPDAQMSAGSEIGAVMGVLMGIVLLFYILVFAVSIAFYVLQAIGVYTIAKRRGIRKPWLAWLPVGDAWIWGSLSDQYQYVKLGKVTNRRRVMLILCAVILAAVILFAGSMIGAAVNSAFLGEGKVALGVGGALLSYFVIIGVTIALAVMEYIALYDIFRSCSPENSVVFLILSILFPVTLPFFLFCNRKKDDGMPPRRKPVPEQLPEEVCQTVTEEAVVSVEAEETPIQEESTEE